MNKEETERLLKDVPYVYLEIQVIDYHGEDDWHTVTDFRYDRTLKQQSVKYYGEIHDWDMESAACDWVEEHYSELDHPDEVEVWVKRSNQPVDEATKVAVTAEPSIEFHGAVL